MFDFDNDLPPDADEHTDHERAGAVPSTAGPVPGAHGDGDMLSVMLGALLRDQGRPLPASRKRRAPETCPAPARNATGHADPMHRTMHDVAQQAAEHVGELFERRLTRGDIGLDTLFRAPRTSTAEIDTRDHPLRTFATREIEPIRRPIVETFPQVTFACCTDAGGLLPADGDTTHQQASAPIFVHGRRWGTFHIGYRAPAPLAPPLGAQRDANWRF